ncbi:Uncharacterized membrane protein YqaE,-like protein of Blt101, UPF0057 family [Geosmithia morbida]|uniref:Uncharacterized membrane protein YqaE,-like protein of Blt101, UPF0057 family n=1 Tax=Geosmithia morbida TaxID=1094350 RepID=A0A9P5D1Q4_9HYPO|nr:Uncharacterized membrane protein YqaE,-like protein of Blt101, UPF0057 family [Geosmithia morbida]KAF4123002.1 Uncharacterized membrane protein YqaE,-like protein of Blt101, UPF0057 family [Geosmithia morbida]
MCSSDIFLGFIALLFPPVAGEYHDLPPYSSTCPGFFTNISLSTVWVKRGICSADSLINICLCVVGFFPGLIHAWYIIAKFPDPWDYDYESLAEENGRPQVIYIVQDQQPPRQQHQMHGNAAPSPYGTVQSHDQSQTYAPTPAEAGSSSQPQHEGVPPSYAQAVAGDHKTQTNS